MAGTETAGVIAQQYWNGAYGNSGVFSEMLDNQGNLTEAEVSWSASNMYYTNIPDQPGNSRMMKGYLDNSNTSFTAVQVTGIPATYSTYDVYVYFDGGNGGAARSASFRHLASGWGSGCAGSNGVIVSGTDAPNTDFSGVFTFATAGSAGNYVVFPDCTGDNFTILAIHGTSTDGAYRAPVNGIQIVSH